MAEVDSIGLCAHCGAPIIPRINKTNGKPSAMPRAYCSRVCKKRASWAREKAKPPRKRAPRNPRVVEGFCPGCGLRFVRFRRGGLGASDAGRYCSRGCFNSTRSVISAEREALRRIALRWKPSPPEVSIVDMEVAALRRIAAWRPGRSPTVRPCAGCGRKTLGLGEYRRVCVSCKAEAKRALRQTDSFKARKREYKARRRALERGITADRIDPIKVFERDGWRCHLCGCKTPRRLRGTYDPRAPEIDHVIPLAAGGAHTWGNVKCACRKCNGEKSDRPLGQLGLDIAA